jgi:hypothetical protein
VAGSDEVAAGSARRRSDTPLVSSIGPLGMEKTGLRSVTSASTSPEEIGPPRRKVADADTAGLSMKDLAS